jgi:hypothetical protein
MFGEWCFVSTILVFKPNTGLGVADSVRGGNTFLREVGPAFGYDRARLGQDESNAWSEPHTVPGKI